MKIVTGNKNKQQEIEKFIKEDFINIDLKEVLGNNITIALYKAKLAKEKVKDDVIVEDITLYVNNEFVPEIKWKQNELKENDKVQLILTLAKTEKNIVKIYTKKLNGVIYLNKCNKYNFGFDNIFFVNNKTSLGDYKLKNPLRKIYKEIIKKSIQPEYIFNLDNIKEYNGKYQNKKPE